jgi:hypothetical protein
VLKVGCVFPCAEHHPVELPPRDGGRAGGAGEQVPASGVHQRRRDAGAAGELRRAALPQPRPADQVYSPDPQRQGAGLMKKDINVAIYWFTDVIKQTLVK